MPNPTEDINFKKALQTEQNQKQRRQKMVLIVIVFIIFSTLVYLYRQNTEPKIQPEILPNTSLSESNFSSSSEAPAESKADQTNNLKVDSLYFTGKIDGKIPFRVILNYSGEAYRGRTYTGQIVYDGVSEYNLKAVAIFVGSADKCQKYYCLVEIEEYDTKFITSDNPNGKLISVFTGQTDLQEKPSKITGTWNNGNNDKKLNFELDISEEFDIENYGVLAYKNSDQTLEIKGNYCGVVGTREIFAGMVTKKIDESADATKDDCYLISDAGQVLLRNCTVESTDEDCGKRYFIFGKRTDSIQYIIDHGFTQDACTAGGDIKILEFDTKTSKINKLGDFSFNACPEPEDPTTNQAYKNAKEKYALPNP
jgi:hypothetical protein